jgi:LasA protease
LHLATEDRRVKVGDHVKAGDAIGHPACESGVSYSTHLHIARRYNGEWIAADCTKCILDAPAPQWNFGGWLVFSYDSEYDGYMTKGDEYREACACREDLNTLRGSTGN